MTLSIEARHLGKRFGPVTAVDEVSFEEPMMGFPSKARVFVEYRRSVTSDTPSDRFTSLAPLLQDILTLSETTQIEGVDPYNKDKRQNGSTGAGGRSVSSRKGQAWREQERGGGHQAHLFTGKRGHHMDFALLYPMLAALRAMVEDGPEGPQRIGGFSARPGAGARAGSPCARRHRPVIAKTFLSAKTFRAYGTNFFRQEKSFRDHGRALGRSM